MSKLRKPLVLSFLFCAVVAMVLWRLNVYTVQERQEQLNKAMMDAVIMRNAAGVRDLLRRGANPNCIQQPGTWKEGIEGKFSSTFVQRFDPSYSGELYATPLVLAALNPNPNVIRILLAAGAIVEQKDNLGETSLEMAKVNDGGEIYAMLKEADAKQKRAMPSGAVAP